MLTTRSVTLPVTLTLALSAAGMLAGPAAASDCQAQLHGAILKATSSGPVRAVLTKQLNGNPVSEQTIEFVPPDRVRIVERSLLPLEVQKQQLDSLRASSPEMAKLAEAGRNPDGTAKAVIYAGPDLFIGTEKQPWPDPDRPTRKASELDELREFASPVVYFARTCSPARIEFEFDTYVYLVLNRDGSQPKLTAAEVDAERKQLRDQQNKDAGHLAAVPAGTLELDAQGRPSRIVREEELPDPKALAMARKMMPGAVPDEIKSLAMDIAFTYDPGITIAVPQ